LCTKCKNRRKKLGGRFAEINNLAKSGQFTLLSDKTVQVSDIILQEDEYEIRYDKLDDAQGDIITQEDLILMVNTTITPELKLEGYARELVRSVQEARKTAGYEVTDRIKLSIAGFEADQIISKFGDYISTETLASIVTNNETSDVQGECDVDDGIINFTIRKE
jgi:isoleucyl-tRNA synthetase